MWLNGVFILPAYTHVYTFLIGREPAYVNEFNENESLTFDSAGYGYCNKYRILIL